MRRSRYYRLRVNPYRGNDGRNVYRLGVGSMPIRSRCANAYSQVTKRTGLVNALILIGTFTFITGIAVLMALYGGGLNTRVALRARVITGYPRWVRKDSSPRLTAIVGDTAAEGHAFPKLRSSLPASGTCKTLARVTLRKQVDT